MLEPMDSESMVSSSIDTWVNLFGDTDTPSDSHMEFTETYLGEQMRVSPDGKMVCSICECEIRSRLTLTIQGSGCGTVVARYPLGRFNRRSEIGGNVKWSPDSTRILVGGMDGKARIIQVFDLSAGELEPICTINENFLIGWERIDWAPDSRSVLVTLTLKMGVRVWRLRDRLPLLTLPAPKTGSGLCFSPCGRLLLILTRKCSQESILVLETKNYSVLKILSQPEAAILEDARFTPIPEVNSIQSNDYKIIMNIYSIIAWEGVAFSGRIFVFTGDTCRVVAFIRDEVEPLEAFGYEKFTEWSLCGRFAVLSSIPIAFSVYNALGMRIGRRISLIECCGSENTIIFREKSFFSASQAYEQSNGPLLGSGTSKSYIQHRGQLKAHYSNTKTQSRLLATFSSDSTLLAVSSSEIPNQPLVILIQSQSVRQITWHDISPLLCIVTSNYHTSRESQIYMWQQGEGAVAVKVPTGVQDLKNIEWATGADTLVVSSPKTFCLAVPNWASV